MTPNLDYGKLDMRSLNFHSTKNLWEKGYYLPTEIPKRSLIKTHNILHSSGYSIPGPKKRDINSYVNYELPGGEGEYERVGHSLQEAEG